MTQAERMDFLEILAETLELITSPRWTPEYADTVTREAILRASLEDD